MKLVLYYANWCPHCKTYLNEWKNIKNNLDIECFEYEDKQDREHIIKENIEYYPTLKFFDSNGNSHLIQDMSLNGIISFIKLKNNTNNNNNIYLFIIAFIILSYLVYIYK
tara:strand:+ start:556 stop:885 length:330 start_codon:yes stop_codon:yes gene_type:complete